MSWASVIFVLTWKANKKDNMFMLPGDEGIHEFQVNSNFVFRS